MPEDSLESYVAAEKAAGYTNREIRTALEKAGYTPKEIDSVLPKQKHPRLLLLGFFLLLALLGFALWWISFTPSTETLPEGEVYTFSDTNKPIEELLAESTNACLAEYQDHTCLALAKHNVSLCSTFDRQDLQEECFEYALVAGIAEKSLTEKDCAQFSSALQALCTDYLRFEGTSDLFCNTLSSPQRELCLGVTTQDLEMCNTLSNSEECYSLVLLAKAISTKDSSPCNNDPELSARCTAALRQDPLICELSAKTLCSDSASAIVAIRLGDAARCADEECRLRTYAISGPLSSCDRLTAPYYATLCRGVFTKDSALCAQVPDSASAHALALRDFCYFEIAGNGNQQELCSLILAPAMRSTCLAGYTHEEPIP